jgi:inhibitor of cysteine peptidase
MRQFIAGILCLLTGMVIACADQGQFITPNVVSVTPVSTKAEEMSVTKVQLKQTDNGKTLLIKVGDVIVIQLPENATTGYRWAIDKLDTSLIEVIGDEHPASSGGAMGAGSVRQLTLAVKQSGTTTLTLKNWREWEGDRSITERFSITLNIHQ